LATAHPNVAQLELLARDRLEEPAASDVRSHVETCAACQKHYARCLADEELASDLRVVAQGPTRIRSGEPAESSEDALFGPMTDESIPGYRLIREIHRGGQGVVYQAVQESTKQRVAIKVMREGPLAGPAERARFEREVAVLGQLQHPGIVAIHDSGTVGGFFYYAMDYISGRSLDDHVAFVKPSIREVFALFSEICDAVNAAHLRGIIHRDLKPSNVLVDAEGAPHIVDFGLAKVTAAGLAADSDQQIVTMTGQFFGSLPWASPEQAEAVPSKIDLRTDVYSLGVILYQMLTDRFPYEVVGNMRDVIDRIVRAEPNRPSTVRREIDGEAETIILKALSKDRERRYQTAGELGRDIQHYLNGEPIEAKRDSAWYVLRKTIWRHKFPVATAVAFVLLVGGFGTSAAILRARAERHRRLAEAQAIRLDQARAAEIITAFDHDPAAALAEWSRAGPRLKGFLTQDAGRYVVSPAYTQRVVGARCAVWTNPQAFWASIDGGPLWRNGEWLELASVGWPDPAPLLTHFEVKAEAGSDRERYVALCLIGQLADPAGGSLADLCASIVRTAHHPGVVSAAKWVAMRLGRDAPHLSGETIRVDDISGLAFVKIPGCDAFRPGSPSDERDRYKNEAMPGKGKPVEPFYLATTETTAATFKSFWQDPDTVRWSEAQAGASEDLRQLAEMTGKALQDQIDRDASNEAVGWISLGMARRFCRWLSARGNSASPPRRYRLPAEHEWEYACRAGNLDRFCFGGNADYARFFANCNGDETRGPVVAQRMPNAFGLFDMHGGLWEWCDSRFPQEYVADPAVTTEQKRNLYVLRGGAYYSPAVRCRSAQRNYGDVDTPGMYWGFRIVMEQLDT